MFFQQNTNWQVETSSAGSSSTSRLSAKTPKASALAQPHLEFHIPALPFVLNNGVTDKADSLYAFCKFPVLDSFLGALF
jgi:hypothetical protein